MTQPPAPRALALEPLTGPAADSLSLPYEGRWRRRAGLLGRATRCQGALRRLDEAAPHPTPACRE
ncbi:MAG: hypothetical protein ACU0DT_13920, partial [Albimonas sp.]|uniref:hypothetical protein n=1 Tax=Albimonas sp. TaxID=1872425 RepID=UPI0040561113